ncbi:MAG: TolC family protein, partial [Candidatus Binatia bacterium]
AVAAHHDAQLQAIVRDAGGRHEALGLAKQQYFPDVNPFVGLTGSVEQVVGAAITFSTMIPQIQAGIREARANLRGAEATLRQARLDRGAALSAALVALHNSDDQRRLLESHVVPAAAQAADTAERAYAAGAGDLPSVIASRRMVLELALTIAEVRTLREQQLAAIEEIAGADVETLGDAEPLAASETGRRDASTPGGRRSLGAGGGGGAGAEIVASTAPTERRPPGPQATGTVNIVADRVSHD